MRNLSLYFNRLRGKIALGAGVLAAEPHEYGISPILCISQAPRTLAATLSALHQVSANYAGDAPPA